MAKNSKINNQYMIALARVKDLEEQNNDKSRQMAEKDKRTKTTEKNMRALCENILATDKDSINFGKGRPWSRTPIDELIRNATKSFAKMQQTFQSAIDTMMDELEEKTAAINELSGKLQDADRKINAYILASNNASIKYEDIDKAIEDEKKKTRESAAKKSLNISSHTAEVIEEDDDDMEDLEESLHDDAAKKNGNAIRIGSNSIPYFKNSRNREKDLTRRINAQAPERYDDIGSLKITDDVEWEILRVIGEYGLSLYPDIKSKVKEGGRIKDTGDTKINALTSGLVGKGALLKESVSYYNGKVLIYQLTPKGERAYLTKYNKPPVMSEAKKITAEHNNYEHGYGIKMLADAIRNSGVFKDVDEFRRRKAERLDPGGKNGASSYIPDILCVDKNNETLFIEYEMGTTPNRDFLAKCAKMCDVTSTLNFVAPNGAVAEKLLEQVEKFIDNRGGGERLYGVTIRVSPAKQLSGVDIRNNNAWKYVFRPERDGKTPTINR